MDNNEGIFTRPELQAVMDLVANKALLAGARATVMIPIIYFVCGR